MNSRWPRLDNLFIKAIRRYLKLLLVLNFVSCFQHCVGHTAHAPPTWTFSTSQKVINLNQFLGESIFTKRQIFTIMRLSASKIQNASVWNPIIYTFYTNSVLDEKFLEKKLLYLNFVWIVAWFLSLAHGKCSSQMNLHTKNGNCNAAE